MKTVHEILAAATKGSVELYSAKDGAEAAEVAWRAYERRKLRERSWENVRENHAV